MRTRNGSPIGENVVTDSLALRGKTVGNLIVGARGELHLYGLCTGNVTVQSEGVAIIYGLVVGNVINEGGTVRIFGTIQKSVYALSGETEIDPRAIVHGDRPSHY